MVIGQTTTNSAVHVCPLCGSAAHPHGRPAVDRALLALALAPLGAHEVRHVALLPCDPPELVPHVHGLEHAHLPHLLRLERRELLLGLFPLFLLRLLLGNLPLLLVLLQLQALLRRDRLDALVLCLHRKGLLVGLLVVVDAEADLEVRVRALPVLELGVRARPDLEGLARVGVDGQGRRAVVRGRAGPAELQQELRAPAVEERPGAAQGDGRGEVLERQRAFPVLQRVRCLLFELGLLLLRLVRELRDAGGGHGGEGRLLHRRQLELLLLRRGAGGDGDGQDLLLEGDADPALLGPAARELLIVQAVAHELDLRDRGACGKAVRRVHAQGVEHLPRVEVDALAHDEAALVQAADDLPAPARRAHRGLLDLLELGGHGQRLLVHHVVVVDLQGPLVVGLGLLPTLDGGESARPDLQGLARVGVQGQRSAAVAHRRPRPLELDQELGTPAVHERVGTANGDGLGDLLQGQLLVARLHGVGALLLEVRLPVLGLVRELPHVRRGHRGEGRLVALVHLRLGLGRLLRHGHGPAVRGGLLRARRRLPAVLLRGLVVVDLEGLLEVGVRVRPLLERRERASADLEGLRQLGVDGQGRAAVVDGGARPLELQQDVRAGAVHKRTGAAQGDGLADLLERRVQLAVLQGVGTLLLQPYLQVPRLLRQLRHAGRRQRGEGGLAAKP
mmetsp:Transcript_16466/g.50859  ORF Transcript_16466/g.50859 Transcript_16466/m.50859 type:complete len:676 (+) Transcript_16466:91-2118(+)